MARRAITQARRLGAEFLTPAKVTAISVEGGYNRLSLDNGQQILHIAGGNILYLRFFGGKAAPPTINRSATSKAEILKALADSFDYGTSLIKEQTDQSMMQVVQTNQFLGPSSRARVIYFLIGHTWDIYGQMAVYLRLNGVVPPASQRP